VLLPTSDAPQLRLVHQAPVGDLLPAGAPRRLEASGVLAEQGRYYVIFDNLRSVAVIHEDLTNVEQNTIVPTGPQGRQAYEDIASDPVTGNVYLLIEAARRGGRYMARVEEYDPALRFLSAGWLEFPLPTRNKGIEGLACVHREGVTYLLGLCEGNRDRAGAAGQRPGGGRIPVFRRGRRNWKHQTTIKLPKTLWFADYSSLSITGERIAVVSQESSALWLGSFAPATWELAGPGSTYLFPRDAHGAVVYCSIEGVCWLRGDAFVVVSDRAKARKRDGRRRATDQSLHIFVLPAEPR
jgi:hypothetical protein